MTPNNKFETPAQKVKREHEEWQKDTTTKSKYRFIVYLLIIGFWYFIYFIYTSGKFTGVTLEDLKNTHILFYYVQLLVRILFFLMLAIGGFGLFFDLEKKIGSYKLDKYADICLKLTKVFFIILAILSFLDVLLNFIYIRSH